MTTSHGDPDARLPAITRTAVHFLESTRFGGTERALAHLLAGLDRRRWRPLLFHPIEPGLEPLLAKAREIGVELHAVPRSWGSRALTGLPQLMRRLRAQRPAVFHAHLNWPLACTGGLAAAALVGTPAVIATAHLFVDVPQGPFHYARQQILATAADRTIAVSRDVAARFLRRFGLTPAKLRVVPNGIDLTRFDRPRPGVNQAPWKAMAGRPVVLTVARLDRQKGHVHLLEAAALVPEATFVLAGDGPERGALESRAGELGLADRVFFLGYRTDVPALLSSCDLFVLPSLFEGLPLAVLEAMAAGKPVIASAIGGVDEVVTHGDTGLLVPPANPPALAGAIRAVLASPLLASRLASAARARVEREFSVEAMVRNVTRIYDEVLSRSAGLRGGAA